MTDPVAPTPGSRLDWADAVKGIAILWIALFHGFIAYDDGRFPWPIGLGNFASFVAGCAQPASVLSSLRCAIEGFVVALIQRGPHPLGVFILLSGFGLTLSLLKAGSPFQGWLSWYRRRLIRLFPMYWVAHALYLISPFTYQHDPVDYRFFLSLLGNRVYPVEAMFFYLNPSWWYVGLLVELYLVFPLLFRLLQRLGRVRFLVLCILVTVGSRYGLSLMEAPGQYVQGAFFGARLWEFAAGMVMAVEYRRSPQEAERRLFSPWGLLGGIALYVAGVYCYRPGFLFVFSDGLIGVGFFILLAHVARLLVKLPMLGAILITAGSYSYGIFLIHQPYVMYWGERLGRLSLPVYLGVACVVLTVVSLVAIALEKLVNRWMSRPKNRPSPSSVS